MTSQDSKLKFYVILNSEATIYRNLRILQQNVEKQKYFKTKSPNFIKVYFKKTHLNKNLGFYEFPNFPTKNRDVKKKHRTYLSAHLCENRITLPFTFRVARYD